MTTNPLRAARGTTATLNTRALKEGELAYNTDTEELHVGDGSTLGGRPISSEVDGDDIDVTSTGSTTARSLADWMAALDMRVANLRDPEFAATQSPTSDNSAAITAAIASLIDRITIDGSSASVVSASNNTITYAGHPFSTGDLVRYKCGTGTVIGGLGDGTRYYVIDTTSSTFKLSSRAGGSAVDISAVGTGSAHTFTKGGGIVYIPPGVWGFSGISAEDDVEIHGAHDGTTVLYLISGSDEHAISSPLFDTYANDSDRASPVGNVSFGLRNLTIDANKAGQSSAKHGLAYYGIALTLEHVEIKNAKGVNIYRESPGGTFSTVVGESLQDSVRDLEIHDGGTGNICWNGQSDSTLFDIRTYETDNGVGSYNAKFMQKSTGVRLVGFHEWGNVETGFIADADTLDIVSGHFENQFSMVQKCFVRGVSYKTSNNPAVTIADGVAGYLVDLILYNWKYAIKYAVLDGGNGVVLGNHYSAVASSDLIDPSGGTPSASTTWLMRANNNSAVARIAIPQLINAMTAETSIATDDLVAIADASAGSSNRKMTVANVLKVINALTADTAPVGTDDYVATYDASASAAKKVLIDLVRGFRQHAQTVDTTNRSTTNSSFETTSVAVSITPKSTASKVRIRVQGVVGGSSAGNMMLTLYRGSTDLTPSGCTEFQGIRIPDQNTVLPFSFEYLDSPASVSALTYSLYFRVGTAITGYLGRRGLDTTYDCPTMITVEEILA